MELLEHTLKNKRLIKLIKDDTHFTGWVIEADTLAHDKYHLDKIKKYLKGTVIDIGANIGTHTDYYATYPSVKKVVAIEPFIPAFKCLRFNMGDYYEVECIHAALGAKKGKTSIKCDNLNVGMAYTSKGEDDYINVITLDSLKLTDVSFIKIDTEGDEIDVLKGGLKTIKRDKPIIDIEINDATLLRKGLTPKDVYDFMTELGYIQIDAIGHAPQVDVIFKHNSL